MPNTSHIPKLKKKLFAEIIRFSVATYFCITHKAFVYKLQLSASVEVNTKVIDLLLNKNITKL